MVKETVEAIAKSENERMVSKPVRNARTLCPTASPSFFDTSPNALSKKEATIPPASRTATRNSPARRVIASPPYPAFLSSSGCGSDPAGASRITEEMISAIDPKSKSRSTIYTAIWALNGTPVLLDTR